MWKSVALAVAALSLGAGRLALNAPQPEAAAPAAGQTFAATCRGDQVLDARPDPKWVSQSFAGDRCQEPAMPAVFDGSRVSRGELVAAMARAKSFQAAAAAFQRCVGDYVVARRAARPLTQAELVIENHRVLTSQRASSRAQAQVNAEVNAFNEYGSDCPDHG